MTNHASRRVFLLPPTDLPDWLGVDDRSRALGLARALAADPALAATGATIVVGLGARPHLAIVGTVDDATAARIEALPSQLEYLLGSLRYVAYEEIERDVELLADQLRDRVGSVSEYRFVAIPRGGLIVLGMLAYALDLDHSQLGAADDDRPVVLVDDVALTGARLRRMLAGASGPPVVFAHLYSHPDLREAIERSEPRVTEVLAARDLVDHAPERLGDRYEQWRAGWRERSDEDYWIGLVDRVCFPWSEPDVSMWNPVTEQVEAGWRLLPPELVLKTRYEAGAVAPVEVQEPGPGPLQPTPRTLAADLGHELVLVDLAAGTSLGLTGVAADMWRALVETGDEAAATARIAGIYAGSDEEIAADLRRLVDDLHGRGLLQRAGDSR